MLLPSPMIGGSCCTVKNGAPVHREQLVEFVHRGFLERGGL